MSLLIEWDVTTAMAVYKVYILSGPNSYHDVPDPENPDHFKVMYVIAPHADQAESFAKGSLRGTLASVLGRPENVTEYAYLDYESYNYHNPDYIGFVPEKERVYLCSLLDDDGKRHMGSRVHETYGEAKRYIRGVAFNRKAIIHAVSRDEL